MSIKPMLATLTDKPFNDPEWIFEIKWDGFRALAEIKLGKVEIYSRNLLSFNQRFRPIVDSLKKIRHQTILDGEVVVLDKHGKSQFQMLQNYLNTGKGRLVYYVFDILFLNGHDLRLEPLIERKKLLKQMLPKLSNVKYSDHVSEKGVPFYNIAKKQTLEGVIAKKIDGSYYSGKRTREWLKIKTGQQQEAVIGGFTEPRGSRKKLGALVLGVYEKGPASTRRRGEAGKLIYIGHTGGGFNDESLDMIYKKLKKLATKQSPFEKIPKTNAPVTWVKPKLVCEVKFEEWTGDGHMRQPIFLGLRVDKSPKEVSREIPI